MAAIIFHCILIVAARSVAGASLTNADDIRIVELQGTVEFSAAGSSTWVAAVTDQKVHPSDRLRTGTRSRVALRWSDKSVLSFDASTEIEVLAPDTVDSQRGLHLIRGIVSFFHRDQPGRIRVMTRGAVAGVEGTEFVMAVNDTDRTTLSVIDGRVKFGNEQAMLVLTNGEQAFADPGRPPIRSPGFIANNILQWCFYYPAVLDPDDLALTQDEQKALDKSLRAYREGDLLGALANFPTALQNGSDNERIYYAALLLSVGQVDQVETILSSLTSTTGEGNAERIVLALRELISAVKRQSDPSIPAPSVATELLAKSYYEQSHAIPGVSLRNALDLARQAVAKSPKFGFAWARVAELEFGFGHNGAAREVLEKSLALLPRNAEALALKGFLLAAESKTREAITWFNSAIAADSALGNAWLGRGLCRIRRGDTAAGREDLLVAAALEPQRAELRAYLGKAYANADDYRRAVKELHLAMKLDPNDPTAWLYAAILEQQENEINDAVRDLKKSESLNDNRSVYRSQLLLDQDRAVRSANLASIYQDAGMSDTAIREAERGVDADYANYSAHLFLADSYTQLVDPNEIGLRYETAKENEYLLANLLSPGAAGTMSQAISEQEYGRSFESDRLGVVSETEFLSRGAWSETGAQYGIEGNSSYDIEGHYSYDPGESQRPNDDFQQRDLTLTLKQQFTPRDGGYMQISDYDANGGDLHQYYAQNMASLGYRFEETQQPNIILGYNHEWNPGIHTLFLFAKLNDNYSFENPAQPTLLEFIPVKKGVTTLKTVQGLAMNEDFANQTDVYSGELQQIWQTAEHNTIVGARAQYGDFDTANIQNHPSLDGEAFARLAVPADQDVSTYFQRVSLYGYHQWQVFDSLRLVGGLTYDWMRFPANIQTAPISDSEHTTSRVSPKAGLIWSPAKDTTVRFAYTRSLGGTSVDQSYQTRLSHPKWPDSFNPFAASFPNRWPQKAPGRNSRAMEYHLRRSLTLKRICHWTGNCSNPKSRKLSARLILIRS
jgi:Tfp pilus assembly protein PilF